MNYKNAAFAGAEEITLPSANMLSALFVLSPQDPSTNDSINHFQFESRTDVERWEEGERWSHCNELVSPQMAVVKLYPHTILFLSYRLLLPLFPSIFIERKAAASAR